MTQNWQITDVAVDSDGIIPLLARYNMIPQFLCESIVDSAIAEISCTAEEKTHACQAFYQYLNLSNESERQAWCLHYSLDQERVELLATRNLRIEKFKEATWGNKVESYFLKRKKFLDKVIYSLIKTQNREIAAELYFRILEGEQTFARLAAEYSMGLEAHTGGIVGPVEFGSVSPNFATLLYTSQVGVVQQPIPFGDCCAIVRVEKLIPAQLDKFMRQRLLKELFDLWLQEQVHKLPDGDKAWMGLNKKVTQAA